MKEFEKTENAAIKGRRYYSPVQQEAATFLETSEETGGEYTLIEMEVGPGGGPAPHYHRSYDEHFEVLQGTLEVLVGKDIRTLNPGEKAVARRNVLHRFRNPTDEPTRFLIEFRPGQPGFEKTMRVAFGLARDGLTYSNGMPKSPYHQALTLEWADIRLPGITSRFRGRPPRPPPHRGDLRDPGRHVHLRR